MARMRAVDAAVLVLEKEGISCAFGVPGAAINPFYSALKARGSIRHVLARHVEAASHMAEGFTRALAEGELAEGVPRRVEVGGVRVVLVRRGVHVRALGDLCSHLGGPLSEGAVQGEAITCPWHGSTFALEDGRVLAGPATMPQPRFEARVRNGYVEVRRLPEAALAA